MPGQCLVSTQSMVCRRGSQGQHRSTGSFYLWFLRGVLGQLFMEGFPRSSQRWENHSSKPGNCSVREPSGVAWLCCIMESSVQAQRPGKIQIFVVFRSICLIRSKFPTEVVTASSLPKLKSAWTSFHAEGGVLCAGMGAGL